ncbi:MAG: glycoside hydrolase family 3 protein [Acidimicrobiales bacterium]
MITRAIAVVVALLVLAAGCGSSESSLGDDAASAVANPEPSGTEPASAEAADVESTSTSEETVVTTDDVDPGPDVAALALQSLTIEEKVGQLFMVVVAGDDANTVSASAGDINERDFGFRTPSEVVAAYNLGGVMYLGPNIVTADQLGTMSADLQQTAQDGSGIGLLVAVDQEGGRVNRITAGVTVFPPAALLAGDDVAVGEAGYLTGRQVAGQGINVVLAPVADLTDPNATGAIGNRSYGTDPVEVAAMVRAAVGGLQGSGVAAAVKHWPGHGSTEIDTHFNLPILDMSQEEWLARDRVPFEAAVDEGVAIVMVGHLVLPALDPEGLPATVSPALIQDQLRTELGFDGVVMTDALVMGAVDNLDPAAVAVQSVAAGADIMLQPSDLPTAYQALLDAVASGELTEAQVDQAALRVLRLKDQLGLLPSGGAGDASS